MVLKYRLARLIYRDSIIEAYPSQEDGKKSNYFTFVEMYIWLILSYDIDSYVITLIH